MRNELTRRRFLGTAAATGLGLGLSGTCVAAQDRPRVEVCNPLLRTPLGLIIDDSCPVINKAYYWIKQRHDWRLKHEPNTAPSGWEVHYDKLDQMPNAIPAAGAWAKTVEQMLFLRFLVGLGVGGLWPNGVALVSECWPRATRPLVAGAMMAGLNAAATNPAVKGLSEYGTPRNVLSMNAAGILPTRNWQTEMFAKADGISFNQFFMEAVPAEWRGLVVGRRNAIMSIVSFAVTLICGQILTHVVFPTGYQIMFLIGFVGEMRRN